MKKTTFFILLTAVLLMTLSVATLAEILSGLHDRGCCGYTHAEDVP